MQSDDKSDGRSSNQRLETPRSVCDSVRHSRRQRALFSTSAQNPQRICHANLAESSRCTVHVRNARHTSSTQHAACLEHAVTSVRTVDCQASRHSPAHESFFPRESRKHRATMNLSLPGETQHPSSHLISTRPPRQTLNLMFWVISRDCLVRCHVSPRGSTEHRQQGFGPSIGTTTD